MVWLQLAWILTGIGAIHHLQHVELQGLNALLNTTFANEWKLQIQVKGHLMELKQALAD